MLFSARYLRSQYSQHCPTWSSAYTKAISNGTPTDVYYFEIKTAHVRLACTDAVCILVATIEASLAQSLSVLCVSTYWHDEALQHFDQIQKSVHYTCSPPIQASHDHPALIDVLKPWALWEKSCTHDEPCMVGLTVRRVTFDAACAISSCRLHVRPTRF